MPQVALDLELRLGEGVADVVGELQAPAELVAERLGRQIRDVADHARDAHAGVGLAAGAVVVARPATPGSAMIAFRAIAFHAMPCGCSACVLAIATNAST